MKLNNKAVVSPQWETDLNVVVAEKLVPLEFVPSFSRIDSKRFSRANLR